MFWRRALLILAVGFAGGGVARAQDPAAQWTPEQVASSIVRKAETTSFAELETFGHQGMKLAAPERLNRLQYVAYILLNQSEFDRFARWNDLLRAEAAKAGSARYERVAALYALRARYDKGDSSTIAPIRNMAETSRDWYVRMEAATTYGYVLVHEHQEAEALKVASEVQDLAPNGAPLAAAATSDVWDVVGLALANLSDLKGSALAFGRAQIQYARPGYPRPDFDDVYNMASLAAKLGRTDLARTLYLDHHRLAMRSDLPMLRIWDRNLCASVAEASEDARTMLACFEGLGQNLGEAAFLAPQILPARAIAYALLNRPREARADLEAIRKLEASHQFSAASFERVALVEAEVLRAEGHDREAFTKLFNYADAHKVLLAQRYSAGIGQLTAEMAKQLDARRAQLATAQRNVVLERDVIHSQKMLEEIGFIGALAGAGLLLWQLRIARQLRRARHRAEAASRAKSEFLANMSHEIRTPLNGVVAVADMLAKANLGQREREMAEIIRTSGDALQRLLSDILDLARIESGRIVIESAPFHVGELVRCVGALSQLHCDEKGIRLEVSIAPELEGFVLGDSMRIRQVLVNFMNNAVKFTGQGSIVLTAEPAAGDGVRFTVRDTGVGFEPSDKARILGRFQQADSSITRRFGGSGLGLAICCELAGLMQGALDCDSSPGQGSTFWIEIPLPRMEAPVAAGVPAESACAPDERLRILLADDHPTNRKVVELMLQDDIADLFSVEDGQAAVQAFRSQTFDLVLMDMQMPVMDGLTAIREIRRFERETGRKPTPILMLTANALPEHIADAEAVGADGHVAKPFTIDALFQAMDRALDPGERETEAAA